MDVDPPPPAAHPTEPESRVDSEKFIRGYVERAAAFARDDLHPPDLSPFADSDDTFAADCQAGDDDLNAVIKLRIAIGIAAQRFGLRVCTKS